MHFRPRVLGCLIALAAAAALPLAAAPAVDAPKRSPLAGVAALDKPVSYTETKIPLGDLVQRVAADTGAPLTAHAGTADEPVSVVVKEMPARELLEQLARHLDYLWMRQSKEGKEQYEIVQDLAGKQREEKLRND